MSSQLAWGQALAEPDGRLPGDAVLDNRLCTLREVALTLLREVDSLRIAQPARGNRADGRLYDEVQRFEIDLISSALSRTAGNQTRAARLLGVKLTTLNTKIKKYKIQFEAGNTVAEGFERQTAA
jgi:transcriptional regulator with GAF, ATPase, and Fis domain